MPKSLTSVTSVSELESVGGTPALVPDVPPRFDGCEKLGALRELSRDVACSSVYELARMTLFTHHAAFADVIQRWHVVVRVLVSSLQAEGLLSLALKTDVLMSCEHGLFLFLASGDRLFIKGLVMRSLG